MDSAVEKARNWLADWEGDECRMSPGERRATEFARALLSSQSQLERMREALENLADATDAVGVRFFDTDTMEPEVEDMQEATKRARAALTKEEKQP